MIRLSYGIGSRTLEHILPYFQKNVDTDKDVIVAVKHGDAGNEAIIISKTGAGDSFITFFYMKHGPNPKMHLTIYKD